MALGRLLRFSDAPKALLPWWLLVLVVVGGAFAGAAVHEATGQDVVAAVVAVLVSGGAAALSRRELARRGRRGFEDWPSADLEYSDDLKVGPLAELLNTTVWFGGGAAAGGLVAATGIGDGQIWFVDAWLACGVLAAWPALDEVDARHALRVRRGRMEEEQRIRDAVGLADPDAPERPVPSTVSTLPPADATGATVVPLNRRSAWKWVAFSLLFVLACGGIGVFATDISIVERVIVLAGVPFMLAAGWMWLGWARAPYFLRLSPSGADPLGAGEVPWSSIVAADVSEHTWHRWLAFELDEPFAGQPWATRALKRLTRRSKGAAVEVTLRLSDWPSEQVLAAVKAHGVEDLDVLIG